MQIPKKILTIFSSRYISTYLCVAMLVMVVFPVGAVEEKAVEQGGYSAHLLILNKITLERKKIVLEIDEGASVGQLLLSLDGCVPEGEADVESDMALIEIVQSVPKTRYLLEGEKVQSVGEEVVFKGWLFSDFPSATVVEHPTYHVRLLGCRED